MSNAVVYGSRSNTLINLLNPAERPTITAQQSGWDQTRSDNTSRQGEHYPAAYGEYSVPPMLSSPTRHNYTPYHFPQHSSPSSYPSWQHPSVPQYSQQAALSESYASAQAPYDHYHDQYRASSSSMEYNPPPPPQPQPPQSLSPLQYSARASTRIVARSTGTPSLESQYSISDHDDGMMYQDASSSRKRSVSHDDDEFGAPPKAKRAKKQHLQRSFGPKGQPQKRGKRRGEVALTLNESQDVSEEPSNGKGKERADHGQFAGYQNLMNDEPGTLVAELQNTRCMAAKYRSDVVSRCLSCTRRWAGDTCRFLGVRWLMRRNGVIEGVSFVKTPYPGAARDVTFPTEWNIPFTQEHRQITMSAAVRTLLPVLKKELHHIQDDEVVYRQREIDCRASCDTCMTSTFSETWMCRTCGREACKDCFLRVEALTMLKHDATAEEVIAHQAMREKYMITNPNFLTCLKRSDHNSSDFTKVTRFVREELEQAIKDMTLIQEQEEEQEENGLSTPELVSSESSTDSSGIRTPTSTTGLDGSSISSRSTSSVSDVPKSLSSPEIPFFEIPRFKTTESISDSTFRRLWGAGQPMLIEGMLERLKIKWDPDYFIHNHGTTSVRLLECQKNFDGGRMTVAEFFSTFGVYQGRDPDTVQKLRDWPPSADFKTIFPALYEDFAQAVPFPDYVRRDGVLNMSSHFPTDVLGPDLGPKMYNAQATHTGPGSQGSTRLHMDMADALNIMTYASKTPDGSNGCAAWDLYRREDSEALRAFLKAEFNFDKHGENLDPIHSQLYYLSDDLRHKLYVQHGVRSYRVYQYPGEAIMIPAGCAHQVANLADCIKVAIDYVSPENINACEQLTREFRAQNIRSAWKDDVLQLRSMMWYAWQSCTKMSTVGDES